MSTATKPERRKLTFASLDEVVADAENLLAKGYDKAGNWDLAQVCNHLAEWLRFPVEGFPRMPLPVRAAFWLLRKTLGKAMFRQYTTKGMPTGKPTLTQTVTQPGGDEAAAVAKLKESAERFKAYTGEIHPSPVFGAMTKDEATKLQLVHCAHHLSFLVPRTS